jgi:hypothetical protein
LNSIGGHPRALTPVVGYAAHVLNEDLHRQSAKPGFARAPPSRKPPCLLSRLEKAHMVWTDALAAPNIVVEKNRPNAN